MLPTSVKSVFKTMSNFCSDSGKKTLANRCLILLASVAGIVAAEATLMPKPTPAAFSNGEPVLIAQQINGRIAHLVCGEFDIMIRFVGTAASDQYSYQTHGLYLDNGYSNDGETYHFFNNDFEYRVTTRGGGSGSLTVLHYGETLLTKSCTWD